MLATHKKGKGQRKVGPSIVADEPLVAVETQGGDLSYLPPSTTVLGASL